MFSALGVAPNGCINSKRDDRLLVNGDCRARHALEYPGTGHHHAVKKAALRKAGIGCHEVVAGHETAGELQFLVEKLVPAAELSLKKTEFGTSG